MGNLCFSSGSRGERASGGVGSQSKGNPENESSETQSEIRSFSYKEINKAISRKCFQKVVIGKGETSIVYKGYLEHDGDVAVKVYLVNSQQQNDALAGLTREILALGEIRHQNIVVLLGYCNESNNLLLVHKFMSKGSVGSHLFADKKKSSPLQWHVRLLIATDAARGLAYLHSKNIMHRDVSIGHILLDDEFHARLTGFGFARMGPTGDRLYVDTVGTFGTAGYNDPHAADTAQVTPKVDTFAFGVVLLELLTGKKAMGVDENGNLRPLLQWVNQNIKEPNYLARICDPDLKDQLDNDATVLQSFVQLAINCTNFNPKDRPEMSKVLETLEGLAQTPKLAHE